MRSRGNYVRLWGGDGRIVGALGGCGVCGRGGRAGAEMGSLQEEALSGVSRAKVLCVRRWEEVWVEADDRAKVFRCDA